MNQKFSKSSLNSQSLSIISVFSSYFFWGFLVLYFWLLGSVSSVEIILHRAFWATCMLWLFAIYSGKVSAIFAAFQSLKNLKYLLISTALLTLNWSLFVYAINTGNVLATSMAYFICPTFVMAIALGIYKEKLNLWQWVSMAFIFLAIMLKIYFAGEFPWLSVSIALSWAIYGMMQRKLTITTINRLTIETTLALPFLIVLFTIWVLATDYEMRFSFELNQINFLLIGCGAATIAPLLLFNFGVKKTPFKWVGIMQYIVPSISFLTAVYILGEELDLASLTSFILIWLAMAFFILAHLKEKKQKSKTQPKIKSKLPSCQS